MRPLKLELKGFTSFRDHQEVDFTQLDVFAIAGPTGSGKSSLLDAMTYALYGRVERVGDRVSQLISQGQPRMAVTLEFEVGSDRYRVTRSTPAKGATKILLEKRNGGGEWTQAGEGADRVREVEPLIAKAIGLTYDGFTRSVLLPQGKFAEFLVGDAKKRREILTELLGLSLFRRMAERAGGIAKESGVRAQERRLSIEREYADITAEALKEAKAAAKDAGKREKALAKAAELVVEILGRWQEAERSLAELTACRDEAGEAAKTVEGVAGELAAEGQRLETMAGEVERRRGASELAQKAVEEAQAALAEAQAAFGSVSDLTRGQARVLALEEAVRTRSMKADQIAAAAEASRALGDGLLQAEGELSKRTEVLAAAESGAERAEGSLEAARHADMVVAVSAGLKVGDPCPVCGLPLEKPPKRTPAGALSRAEKALARARATLEKARKAATEADRIRHGAQRDVQANAGEQERLAAEMAELESRIGGEESALAELFGTLPPQDPAAAIQERLDGLQRLDRAEREGAKQAAEAAQALVEAERERDGATGRMARIRDRLAIDHRPLFKRVARIIGPAAGPVVLPIAPSGDEVPPFLAYAQGLGEALQALGAQLRSEVDDRSSTERRLLGEANEKAAGLVEPADTLQALAASVNAECRRATTKVAMAAQRAAEVADRLERKSRLTEEVKGLDERTSVFKTLANELRADRLIAFLQEEALQILALAGSERLQSLSDGRYRIVCRADEFSVVDTWNGDEERSVRTLSGGETFLASLALALALADQVRSLSVTDQARLDSLFLDEGFGTLDQETLETVKSAIELLAGDGRLVGIITHVRDLAEQFPRIEVEKSHRGSRLTWVA